MQTFGQHKFSLFYFYKSGKEAVTECFTVTYICYYIIIIIIIILLFDTDNWDTGSNQKGGKFHFGHLWLYSVRDLYKLAHIH